MLDGCRFFPQDFVGDGQNGWHSNLQTPIYNLQLWLIIAKEGEVVWINASLAEVVSQIRELEKRQGGEGGDWNIDDFERLNALRLTAEQLRKQNAPLREEVVAARAQVSRKQVLSPRERDLIVESS